VLNNNKEGDNDHLLFGGGHRFRVCLVFFSFFFLSCAVGKFTFALCGLVVH
jgi:hypothetical protein